ncbi:MAG TPA: glycosyltransferase family 4 protein [Tepidisphaeraceae bacterium]|jgi:glycosyltransferase involved in cell wall biosynthesis
MTSASASPVTIATPDSAGFPAPAVAPTVVIATLAPVHGETGVQTHSRTLHAGLTGIGHTCLLQTPLASSRMWVPIFAIRPLILGRLKNKTWSTWWLRKWHEAALLRGLVHEARKRNVTAIIAQCPVSARAAMHARRQLGENFTIAMVCHFNYSEATEYRDKGELASQRYFDSVLAMEKQVLESVDRVIYVSNWARDVVEKERDIHPRASSVIWNGVNGHIPPSKLTRTDLGLSTDDVVLISVGTLEPRKNQLALVKLFAKIASHHPRARLVLIGDGPSRGQIESTIAELGLESKVRLLGFRKDVPDLLPLADLYVHASLLENCPMVLLEAARAKLPVAAVPAGGVPELLAALGGTAIDLDNLASLEPLLASSEARAQAGAVARTAFERHFTRQAMIDAYVQTLELVPGTGGKVGL